MMEEVATVASIGSNGVTLNCEIKSTCSSCQQVEQCGSGQVAKAFPHKKLILKLNSELPLNIGDKVIIGLSEKCVLQIAWQVYLWPLLGLILFSGVAQWLVSQNIIEFELIAVLIGILGGYVGFKLAKWRVGQLNNHEKMMPKILRVIDKSLVITQINS